jgi:hypothetical protein
MVTNSDHIQRTNRRISTDHCGLYGTAGTQWILLLVIMTNFYYHGAATDGRGALTDDALRFRGRWGCIRASS